MEWVPLANTKRILKEWEKLTDTTRNYWALGTQNWLNEGFLTYTKLNRD